MENVNKVVIDKGVIEGLSQPLIVYDNVEQQAS
jgi:hypothetical protein